jgi:hypothetical protein
MGRCSSGPAGAGLDPSHRLVGQLIESDDGLLEIFFLGVFDFVVADAVEALDEHHDGGDAGARDFGGVVKGAANFLPFRRACTIGSRA